MKLYFGLIYPYLVYYITVWGASNKSVINSLQNTQNKSVRADNGSPLFNALKIFNVKRVYNYILCIYIKKSLSRNENIFVRYENQHNTRWALNHALHVPYTYSIQSIQSTTYSRSRILNTVPVNIRSCECFVTFKYRLKAHILTQLSTSYSQINRIVIILSRISFTIIFKYLS